MADVSGFCSQQFAPLRAEFERQLDSGAELGASLAVTVAGVPVVDLWGGWADVDRTKPWEHDTITCVWSTTKTITVIAALTLVDKGKLDVFAPVARYWPEFGANGKQRVEVRHLLSHTSGVSGWEQPFRYAEVYDWKASTAHLAAQAPWWEPGSASGYHSTTHGHLVGEVVRRITGQSLGRYVADEIAGPLGADFIIGLHTDDLERVSDVCYPGYVDVEVLDEPESVAAKPRHSPSIWPGRRRQPGGKQRFRRRTGTGTPARWPASTHWYPMRGGSATSSCCHPRPSNSSSRSNPTAWIWPWECRCDSASDSACRS